MSTRARVRLIIRQVKILEEVYKNINKKICIYTSAENLIKYKDLLFIENVNRSNNLNVFITLEEKLIDFDFKNYSLKSFKNLEKLHNSKILDYSLELS